MNRTIMTLTSATALLLPAFVLAPAHASLGGSSHIDLASLSGPGGDMGWQSLPGTQKLTGIRLTQHQETFAPLDFDPINPGTSRPVQPARAPIWPSPLMQKPAQPAIAPPPPAEPPPPAAASAAPAPGYYPPVPRPLPAYAAPPPGYAPASGQPAARTYQPAGGAPRRPAYRPAPYNPWGMMPPPPPPPPKTDWGNNPFGPPIPPRAATGNVWSFGARSNSAATGKARQAPAYGYAGPAWEHRFAPSDPIGQDAGKNNTKPAYPYQGAMPPGYGWPGYPPYPGYR